MNTDRPDLRTIDFAIQEEPGAVITTPVSWALQTADKNFVCEDCKQTIGERQRMFFIVAKPEKGWRHVYVDDCKEETDAKLSV